MNAPASIPKYGLNLDSNPYSLVCGIGVLPQGHLYLPIKTLNIYVRPINKVLKTISKCLLFQQLSTGVAYKLEKTLTWDEIDSIQEEAMKYFVGENNITKGLYYVIDRYEKELLTSAPAYWLLLVNGILLILFFLFMICQYNHYKGGPPTGAFNEGVLDKFLGIFFRVLTGLILVELLLRVMLFLDSHLQIWHVVILVILAVGGFVLLLVLF